MIVPSLRRVMEIVRENALMVVASPCALVISATSAKPIPEPGC